VKHIAGVSSLGCLQVRLDLDVRGLQGEAGSSVTGYTANGVTAGVAGGL
jgi:hypothetical protein